MFSADIERDQHSIKRFRIWSNSGPYSVQMRENKDQNNSKYGHFSRNAVAWNELRSLYLYYF